MMKKLTSSAMQPAETLFGLLWCVIHFFLLSDLLPRLCAVYLPRLTASAVNALYYTVSLAILLLIYRRYLSAAARVFQHHIGRCLAAFLLGFAVYLLYALARQYLFRLWGIEFLTYNDDLFSRYASEDLWPLGYCALFAAPICEELLLRGVVFEALQRRSVILAYALSSLLFGLIHTWQFLFVRDFTAVLLCCLSYIPAGLVFAGVYRKSGTVFPAILLHSTLNVLSVLKYL